jgi:phenylalanyl-tRNA synthetase alpha chain
MLQTIDELERTALDELGAAGDPAELEAWRVRYLGSKGKLKAAMAGLKDVPKEDKPAVGQRMNAIKQSLQHAFDERKDALDGPAGAATTAKPAGPIVDITIPGRGQPLGRTHIITRVRRELCNVFARMGFDVADGPEIEDDDHNFVKLNIPDGHPAREPIDNFYVDEPDGGTFHNGGRPRMLRSQTSTVQIRVMQDAVRKGWGPPLKIVAPGRVYRPDTVDATHSFMFHQIEGLYIDRRVTMVDLKTTLMQFARIYFGPDAEVRLRPSFFPFTEPSAEFDMKIALNPDEPPKWVELGGCGMVDPAVLEGVGVDPEEWTGFAFGFGIERIAMGRYDIPDIRMLFEGDLRFLEQI